MINKLLLLLPRIMLKMFLQFHLVFATVERAAALILRPTFFCKLYYYYCWVQKQVLLHKTEAIKS